MPSIPFNPYFNNARGNDPDQDQVALFIDWDNLVISNYADRGANRPNIEVIVQKAQQYGTVVIARAYAEWTVMIDRLEVYKAGVEPIYAPVFHSDRDLSGQTGKGKSLADPVMVTDCIDFLHLLPQVGTYVLVTGDKDMMPVVRLAKLRGRRVVVIGPDYVANVLQQVCDEFVPYRMLLATAQPMDPYAAYYQQGGYYPQMPPGYYPPQMPAAPQSPATDSRSRSSRRLPGGRRSSSPAQQPYKDVTPPAAQQPPQAAPYGYYYYGTPQQPGYPVPGSYPAQPQQGYIPGYTPETPQQPVTPPAVQPTPAPQPAPQPVQQTQPQAQPSAPTQAQPTRPTTPSAPERSSTANFEEVKDTIRAILSSRAASGRGQMRARDLKEELLRRMPSFNERRYGYSKFKALLNAVEQAGILQMYQSGHILWISQPGAPKLAEGEEQSEFDEVVLDAASPVVEDEIEDEEEEEEETAEPESEAATTEGFEAAVEAPEHFEEAAPVLRAGTTAEPNRFEGAIEAPEREERYTPTIAAEERTTSLAETPLTIQSEREKEQYQPAPVAVEPPKPATGKKATERIPGVGARPALLEQPYYEDVILLIENLRHRNRWLGYELLLSSVRDYLTKHMPESEAKSHAGSILSKLLNEGVLKMAMEVHSRGARKMRVQVAHLQQEHPSVRYTMAAAEARKAAETEKVATPATEAEGQPQAEGGLSVLDAQTFEAVAEPAAGTEATLVADEGGVPVIQATPEQEATPEAQVEQPQTEAGQPEGVAEAQALHFGDQTQMEGETGQLPQEPEMQAQVATEAPEQTPEPQVEAAAEAGDLGHEAQPVHPEQAHDPVPEVEQPGQESSADQSQQSIAFEVHQPEQEVSQEAYPQHEGGYAAPESGAEGQEQPSEPVQESAASDEVYQASPAGELTTENQGTPEGEQQPAPTMGEPGLENTGAPEGEQHIPLSAGEPSLEGRPAYEQEGQPQSHEPNYEHEHHHEHHDGHEHEHGQVTSESVTAEVAETSGAEGHTGEHVQSEPLHTPEGEQPAPAGGFINTTVELEAAPTEGAAQDNHAEGEAEEEVEPGAETVPGTPHRPRRRRTHRPANHENRSEAMAQPRESCRSFGRRPPRLPRGDNKRKPQN